MPRGDYNIFWTLALAVFYLWRIRPFSLDTELMCCKRHTLVVTLLFGTKIFCLHVYVKMYITKIGTASGPRKRSHSLVYNVRLIDILQLTLCCQNRIEKRQSFVIHFVREEFCARHRSDSFLIV